MADETFSAYVAALPAATAAPTSGDTLWINNGGTPKKIDGSLIGGGGGGGTVFDTLAASLFKHYYAGHEASGTTLTDSGSVGGADGAYSGSDTIYQTVALRGDGNGNPFFGGSSGWLTVPDNTGSSACTFMGMFAISPATSGLPVLWSSTTDASVHGFQLWLPNEYQVEFQWGDGSSATTIQTNAAWGNLAIFGAPMTVIFTHNGTVGALFINGIKVGSATHGYAKSGNANIMVGAYQSGPADFAVGVFGKTGVLDSALTDADVYSLQNAQRCA
jgi:hypothetical protein